MGDTALYSCRGGSPALTTPHMAPAPSPPRGPCSSACESTPTPLGTPLCFNVPSHLQLPPTHLWPPFPTPPPALPKATSYHHSLSCLDL